MSESETLSANGSGLGARRDSQLLWLSVIYPLTAVPSHLNGWSDGPFTGLVRAISAADRLRYYSNKASAQALTDRRHRVLGPDEPEIGGVRADAVELFSPRRLGAATAPPAYLVVHFAYTGSGTVTLAFRRFSDLVRPGTAGCREFFQEHVTEIAPASFGDTGRVPSLVLLDLSDDSSLWAEVPLVNSSVVGSESIEPWMASAIALTRDRKSLSHPYPVEIRQPSISTALAASGTSVGIARLRPTGPSHVDEMRTWWMDALLLSSFRRDQYGSWAEEIAALAGAAQGNWARADHRFRAWRSVYAWQLSVDRPVESAIVATVDRSAGVSVAADQVSRELRDHANAAIVHAQDRLTAVLSVLTVCGLVLGLGTAMVGEARGWGLADVLTYGSLVVLLLLSLTFAVFVGRRDWWQFIDRQSDT